MTTIGIVAEWNPFHNGHQRLIDQIRADRPEAVVCDERGFLSARRGQLL